MDPIIPFFGGIFRDIDDEADFVDFLHKGIAEVVQLNLDIVYEALCVLGIPSDGVNCRFFWLLRLMRRLLNLMTLLNKLIQGCILSIILVFLFSTAKEVSLITG